MLKPLHDNLLVKQMRLKIKKGGLILPEAAKEKSKIALVLEVGPGKLDKDGKRTEPIKRGTVFYSETMLSTSSLMKARTINCERV